MKTTIEPKDQVDEWIARLVPGKSFVDIGGIGVNSVNERVTFAHSAEARACVMADIAPTTSSEWRIQYVEYGELSVGPNWFFYSDNAFRAMLRVCRFEILDEYKWQDHTLQVLCRPMP